MTNLRVRYPFPENLLRRLLFCPPTTLPTGCIEWTGRCDARWGYSRFRVNGQMTYGHRAAYEMVRGPIPDGLVLDHLCRNPPCVNPGHLEPVTDLENIRRGEKGILSPTEPRHATGCPCPACVILRHERAEYHRAQARRNRERLDQDPDAVEHGLYTTYSNWDCRCDPCREAWRTYCAARRAKKKSLVAAGDPSVPHGTATCYTNWGCRCNLCREAKRGMR